MNTPNNVLMPVHPEEQQTIEERESEKKPSPRLTLLENLIEIGNIHGNLGGKPDSVFEAAAEHLEIVCNKLELSPTQAVLLGDLFSVCNGYSVDAMELAKHMKCKPIEVCAYIDDFEVLDRKSLVEFSIENKHFSRSGISFKIPLKTVGALQNSEMPGTRWAKDLTSQEFMERASRICEERNMDRDEYARVVKAFEMLLDGNSHLEIVKGIRACALDQDNGLLLLRFCTYYVVFEDEELSMSDLEGCFQHRSNFSNARLNLRKEKHPLQEKGLIEFVNRGGFAQKDIFCLTEKAKTELLVEYENLLSAKPVAGLTAPGTIVEKKLFYPSATARSVRELTDLIRVDNFQKVWESLREKGMRTGFACLFSGGPGTGKTETALQIAKETGRSIFKVDISNTKSCFFGESEKKIKGIFNHYRSAYKYCEVTPILLFNEADAVFGKRQQIGETRNGPAQTENAIQNIILQELESLEGILIATTNLSDNMDKAFERRFLYKIEFGNPTLDARKSIWQTMIPDLSVEDIEVLAETYDFSGGQIENISRRRTVAQVLHGKSPVLKELMAYCDEERSDGAFENRIGFV